LDELPEGRIMNRCKAALWASLVLAGSAQAQSPADQPISVGETVRGDLRAGDRKADDGSLLDSFTFQGRAGQRISVTLRSTDFDAYLHLVRDGQPLESDDDGAGQSDAQINFTLPATGTYQLWANTLEANESGGYSLSLTQTFANVGPTPAPRAIRLGQSVSGELALGDALAEDDSYYDAYRFRGEAGQRITARLSSRDFDAFLSLHRAGSPRDIATNDDANEDSRGDAEFSFTLPATGDYDLWANTLLKAKTGAYRLSLERAAPTGPKPVALRFDRPVKGELKEGDATAGDASLYDLYRFSGRKGQQVIVTMTSSELDAYLSIHRKGVMAELVTNDDGPDGSDSRLVFTLPENGEYDIWANSAERGESGTYGLTLRRGVGAAPVRTVARAAPAPIALAVGRPAQGRLEDGDVQAEDGSRYDDYTFQAEAGREYVINLRSGEFDTWLILLRNGEPMEFNNDEGDGSDSEITFTAGSAGEYGIHAGALILDERGAYELSVRLK